MGQACLWTENQLRKKKGRRKAREGESWAPSPTLVSPQASSSLTHHGPAALGANSCLCADVLPPPISMASYQFLITFEFVHSSFHFPWYFQPALWTWHLCPGQGMAIGSSVVSCSDPVPSLTWEGCSLKHREDPMISLLNPRIPSVT